MKATNIIKQLREYIADMRKEHPEITDDMLYTEGTDENIFYMNGNDGTLCDYVANNRLCEFTLIYKRTLSSFITVYIDVDDCMYGYLYPNEGLSLPIKFKRVQLEHGSALLLATLMNLQADKKGLYDKPIDIINLNYNVKHDDCYRFISESGCE